MSNTTVNWRTRLEQGLAANGSVKSIRVIAEQTFAVLGVAAVLHQLALSDVIPSLAAFVTALILGMMWGLQKCTLPSSRQGSRGRTKVRIAVGDLLEAPQNAHLVIGVNERFDSSVGDRVSPRSLHGQMIERLFNGDQSRFEREVDKGLSTSGAEPTVKEVYGERAVYPVGTTVALQSGVRRIFVVAIARTNTANHEASCTVEELWNSLVSLWPTVRQQSNGQPCFVPVLGTGFARVPLRHQAVLELLLSSIEHESARAPITAGGVTVVLYPGDYKEFDIRSVSLD
ncbi:MAG: DUF6430 domain-containing protein [Dehalococcoidia bacterium]